MVLSVRNKVPLLLCSLSIRNRVLSGLTGGEEEVEVTRENHGLLHGDTKLRIPVRSRI
jgi:hypothetical protein